MPKSNGEIINRNFADIFSGEMRYVIPFFQRGFVWGSRNWNQLKQDIEEQVLEPAQNDDLDEQEHFFGPVVVAEQSGDPRFKVFDIIDGQQRFTTVYLMLAYFRRRLETLLAKAPQAREHYDAVGRWLINRTDERQAHDDYWRIKLFSVKGDRLATYYSVFGENRNPATPTLQEDLYLFFPNGNIRGKFERWMGRNFGDMGDEDMWRWIRALTECLKVVWIPLGSRDDPQAIFESLNDKGIPLTAAELMCNYLFKPLIMDGVDHESLHRSHWVNVQQIDRSSPVADSFDFEEYLRHLFSIGHSKIIGKGRRLYVSFKQHNKKLDAGAARRYLDDIAGSAPLYRRILGESTDGSAADGMLRKIGDTNMTSCRPFLLAVLQQERDGAIAIEEAANLIGTVYVLLVRRKVAELPVTRYDSFFPSLAGRIAGRDPADLAATLRDAIKKEQLWVGDDEFRDALMKRPVYRPREVGFTQLVLEEIDRRLANERGGELPDYSTLDTVEHIAPQDIRSSGDWQREMGKDARSDDYSRIVNTIGNLCLRKHERNSEMGRRPFAEKRCLLRESPSRLALDAAERAGPWNFAAVEKRSAHLARTAAAVWAWSASS